MPLPHTLARRQWRGERGLVAEKKSSCSADYKLEDKKKKHKLFPIPIYCAPQAKPDARQLERRKRSKTHIHRKRRQIGKTIPRLDRIKGVSYYPASSRTGGGVKERERQKSTISLVISAK